MEGLFPNLPDEIGRQCLLRVSSKSHYKLLKVCKSWKAVVSSPQFYEDRKLLHLSEQSICLITHENHQRRKWCADSDYDPRFGVTVYDPVEHEWERLSFIPKEKRPGLPIPVAVNQKLFMIGHRIPSGPPFSKSAIACDFLFRSWDWKIADMDTPGILCGCAASPEGQIYSAGGDLKNAATFYNVEENQWHPLPHMMREMDSCTGVFVDGKFYVISLPEQHIEVFDSRTGVWSILEWTDPWSSWGLVSAFGRLYSFNYEVKEFDCNKNVWKEVERLPRFLRKVHFATVWRDKIFLGGRGQGKGAKEHCHQDTVFYMYTPPQQWTPVRGPPGFCCSVELAAIVDM